MTISHQILGQPGRDNAMLVRIDSGQSLHHLLFDCGEACLDGVPFGVLKEIEHLFFSHQHMDHVAGFDSFFRANYARDSKPNHVWGPPGSNAILHHRLQGYLWNLHESMNASWLLHEVHPRETCTQRAELREAFRTLHAEPSMPSNHVLLDTPVFTVEAFAMNHGTTTLAYVVREKARFNIQSEKLAARGWKPGPWLKRLRDPYVDLGETVNIQGNSISMRDLRAELVAETPGQSIAYLTDFRLDDEAMESLALQLHGVETMVCECQYRHRDEELALRNFHMTTQRTARLAQKANAGSLVLFHLSDRYQRDEWAEMLEEVRAVFPNARFPEGWLR